MMYYNDFFFPHLFFGPLFMFVFWALIIWGVFSFVKYLSGTSQGEHDKAKQILRERYAKGDLTKEQFETMKKDID